MSSERVVAVDLHPDYASTWLGEEMARERGARIVRVQHHAAHAAAVLAEHGRWPPREEPALAVILDGTGLGPDGTSWGGEWLEVRGDGSWRRLAHLEPVRLVGGEAAVREPWRVAAAALSAAVAVSQNARKTGKDLVLATVIGYEIQCRLCDAASLRAGGWDHVTYGALSTALLSAKLWGLSVEQMEHALGLSGVCNITTRQTRTGQISDWKACAFANSARNGVFAADLARRGLTGPHEIFEGPKGLMKQLNLSGLKELVLGRDGDFMIDKTYIKFWPAEYHSQSAIDACLQLRPQIKGKQIKDILIKSFEAAVSIIGSEPEKLRPTSRETADHSMFYCCAAALVDGDVTLATFDDKRLTDPKLLDLIDKTKIVEDAALNKGYPKGIPNDITITCADGSKVNKRVDFPRGHAGNPMTDDEVVAKFKRMANGVISDATADKILDTAWKLDTLKDVTSLFTFDVL